MAEKHYHAGKLFNKFLKMTLGNYAGSKFDLRIDNSAVKGLTPPYIVLANHTNFWDPFLLSLCFPDPVFYLASDAYFRHPLLRLALTKLVGAIPKTKFQSDPQSIRAVIKVKKNKGIIGIFPEGRRNWDGKTTALLKPTAKLIKSLEIPVVSVLFEGAYLGMPRWASKARKGYLSMTASIAVDAAEIKDLTVDEIYTRISDSLRYDEYEYQKQHMHRYIGKNPAEKLERFLFSCPVCKTIGALSSSGDHFSCSHCGYDVQYNDYGFFEAGQQEPQEQAPARSEVVFDNPRDWGVWQLEQLNLLAEDRILQEDGLPLFEDAHVILRTGQRSGRLNKGTQNGILTAYADRIVYRAGSEILHTLPVREIIGQNIQYNSQLEFYIKKDLYRFHREDGSFSAYKWVQFIDVIKSKRNRQKAAAAADVAATKE